VSKFINPHEQIARLEERVEELEAALDEMIDWFKPAEDDHGDTWRVWSRSLNVLHPPVPQTETASEPNYNVMPWHISKIVPGCQCQGCLTQANRGGVK
jgi:hypothetical protein